MNFFTDQDVYRSTVACLEGLGQDVATAMSLGLAKADDAEILKSAQEHKRILVT